MRILLVYDHGEKVSLYLIENPIPKHIAFLEEANNKYVNQDKINTGMSFLIDALAENEIECENKNYFGIWRNMIIQAPVKGPLDKVYFSGFAL